MTSVTSTSSSQTTLTSTTLTVVSSSTQVFSDATTSKMAISAETASDVAYSTRVTPETSVEESGVLTSSPSSIGDVTTPSFVFNLTSKDHVSSIVTVTPTVVTTTPRDVDIRWWSRDKLLLGGVVLAILVTLVLLLLLLQSRASCCKKFNYLPVPTSEQNRAKLAGVLTSTVTQPKTTCSKDVEAQRNGLEAVT